VPYLRQTVPVGHQIGRAHGLSDRGWLRQSTSAHRPRTENTEMALAQLGAPREADARNPNIVVVIPPSVASRNNEKVFNRNHSAI
jgi:hypothetical protein